LAGIYPDYRRYPPQSPRPSRPTSLGGAAPGQGQAPSGWGPYPTLDPGAPPPPQTPEVKEGLGEKAQKKRKRGRPSPPLLITSYPYAPTPPAHTRIYTHIHPASSIQHLIPLFSPLLSAAASGVPPVRPGVPWLTQWAGPRRGWSSGPDRAATDRPWPPWLWRFGGHPPPLRPGAAGWASGIPAGSPLPRGSFWPSPFLRGSTPRGFRYSPSGEASFPLSGESRGSPPPKGTKGAEAPWAGNPGQAGPGFPSHRDGGGFVHRREYGALHCSHSPSYWPGLPLSLAAVFLGPSRGQRRGTVPQCSTPYGSRGLVIAPAKAQRTRGEVPALERGTRTFPPSRPRRPLSRPFPLRGSGARGTTARDGGAGPQAGCSAKGGSLTLPCSA